MANTVKKVSCYNTIQNLSKKTTSIFSSKYALSAPPAVADETEHGRGCRRSLNMDVDAGCRRSLNMDVDAGCRRSLNMIP
jgi:hypothetical protein